VFCIDGAPGGVLQVVDDRTRIDPGIRTEKRNIWAWDTGGKGTRRLGPSDGDTAAFFVVLMHLVSVCVLSMLARTVAPMLAWKRLAVYDDRLSSSEKIDG
jgi:hypothetical protein